MLTRTEARKIAREMVRAGFRGVTICENVSDGGIVVKATNVCSMPRTVETVADWTDLKTERI